MVNTALFIASEKGYLCLKHIIANGYRQNISFVVTFKEVNVLKSYDEDIASFCIQNEIKCFKWSEVRKNLCDIIRENKVDIAFTISWKFLIDTEINNIIKYGLVVFHDSILPKYRGFAPTPTAIMCGEQYVGISALFANDGIDEGDIILQKKLFVDDNDYIADIIKKEGDICAEMMTEIIHMADTDTINRIKQNDDEATYSIWRNPEDCRIDWNRSNVEIRNMIRAVSSPYPGAYCFYQGRKIIIDRADIIDDMKFAVRQPGKIWSIVNSCPNVICGTGMLKIISAHFEDGTKVVFDKLRYNLSTEVIK